MQNLVKINAVIANKLNVEKYWLKVVYRIFHLCSDVMSLIMSLAVMQIVMILWKKKFC